MLSLIKTTTLLPFGFAPWLGRILRETFAEGEAASVSVFKDKAGADESVRLAADYVKEHLSKFITQKPEIIEGPIKAHD
jgi:hypothetical protein